MSAVYCTLRVSHNTLYQWSTAYHGIVDLTYSTFLKGNPSALLATVHKVLYIAMEAIPQLALISIPTTLMFLRGFSFDDISPAFIGGATWILFGILSVFYPWNVLTDLNEMFHQKTLTSALPNQPVIEKMVTFLGSGKSILLHGATGSGKSATVRALVEFLESDKCPPALKGKHIVSLCLEEMMADHHEFMKNLVAVLKVVRLDPNAILCIDEIHRLTQSVHGIKISDTLKLYFEGEGSQGKSLFIQSIGLTTTEELHIMKKADTAFLRRFIDISMPTTPEKKLCSDVIQQKAQESHWHLDESAISCAITTGQTYFSTIALPACALRVLEIVDAIKKRQRDSSPLTEHDIQQAIQSGFIEKQ